MLVSALAACNPETPPSPRPRERLGLPEVAWNDGLEAYPAHRPEAALGIEPYQRYCATCHGADGAGQTEVGLALQPAPTDFTDHAYMLEQRPAWYHRSLVKGIPGSAMQPWDHLLDEDGLWDLSFYVWALSTPPETLERGAEIYAARCLECHGVDGRGVLERQFDDPSRVESSRQAEIEQFADGHARLAAALTAEDLEAAVQHSWTFLYLPAK